MGPVNSVPADGDDLYHDPDPRLSQQHHQQQQQQQQQQEEEEEDHTMSHRKTPSLLHQPQQSISNAASRSISMMKSQFTSPVRDNNDYGGDGSAEFSSPNFQQSISMKVQQQNQKIKQIRQKIPKSLPLPVGRRKSSGPRHVVNVMYATEARPHHNNNTTNHLEDDIRNLSLDNHHHPQQQQQQQPTLHHYQHQKQHLTPLKTSGLTNDDEETEWIKAWEDDDSSDEEDPMTIQPNSSFASSKPAVPDIFRVSMDGAHSSSSPIKPHPPQPSPHHPPIPPPTPTAAARSQPQPQQYPYHNQTTTTTSNNQNDQLSLIQQADSAINRGIDWDMAPLRNSATPYEKPNVNMFAPFLRVLGKGAFGKVVLVQKRTGDETGSLYAMKILKKSHLAKQTQIERTKTERKVLKMVNHPFIMKLHYAFQTDDKLYLVLDYCPGGELFFHLSRHRQFPEGVARFYAAELLLAISHMHLNKIIYRDLKPENVLLDAQGHVKLGDFGLAKCGIIHPYKGAQSVCGTPEYMAPEILLSQGHGFCVDYWGLGMLIFEMMTGLPPWYTTDRTKLCNRLTRARLEVPNYFSPPAASCVLALLDKNPRNRLGVMGVRSVIAHDFFHPIDFRALHAKQIKPRLVPTDGWENISNRMKNDSNGGPQLSHAKIDQLTGNFHEQFTRMPVDSMEDGGGNNNDNDLNENYLGFTFDQVEDEHPFDAKGHNGYAT